MCKYVINFNLQIGYNITLPIYDHLSYYIHGTYIVIYINMEIFWNYFCYCFINYKLTDYIAYLMCDDYNSNNLNFEVLKLKFGSLKLLNVYS